MVVTTVFRFVARQTKSLVGEELMGRGVDASPDSHAEKSQYMCESRL